MKYPALFRLVKEAKSSPEVELEVLFDGLTSGRITRCKGIRYYHVGKHKDWWAIHTDPRYWEFIDPNTWVDAFGVRHNKIKGDTT